MFQRFSTREIKELIISVFVMSIAVSIANKNAAFFLVSLIIIGPAFIFHELGHKFTAQNFGYFAEYRMWKEGLLFALLLSFTGFIFVAPGAVYFGGIFSRPRKDEIGKIGISGPIVNLSLAFFFALFSFSKSTFLSSLSYLGVYINSWLAIFNLIPFPPLDGEKIFSWNKKIWALALLISIGLFAWVNL